jgi:hypothetical protein
LIGWLVVQARKHGLMEDEAEEEEEEEGVRGLGDFGFSVAPRKVGTFLQFWTRVLFYFMCSHVVWAQGAGAENDERVVEREDDFENIVDTFSDDEGDEEALAAARAKKEAEEDKRNRDQASSQLL